MYPHLKPLYNKWDYKVFRANVVAELKKNFPNYTFSIKKSSNNCIYINWENGLTSEEVKKITRKFVDHTSDISGDYRDYNPSNFNRVFGGINYISEERSKSEEIQKLSEEISKFFPEMDKYDQQKILHRVFCKTSFPPDAHNFRLELDKNADGILERNLRIKFDTKTDKNEKVLKDLDLRIVDYSEKAFAVYGDTFAVKDELTELGGAYNKKLRDGAGFIFSKKDMIKYSFLLKKSRKKGMCVISHPKKIKIEFIKIINKSIVYYGYKM